MTYEDYKSKLFAFYQLKEKIDYLQDRSSDYTLNQESIEYFRNEYITKQKELDEKLNGKYIQFPVIYKNGDRKLKQRKVATGEFESLKPYTDYNNYVESVLAVRKDLDITEEDPTLCCSNEMYCASLAEMSDLLLKIKSFETRIKKLKKIINDYELVHGEEIK